MCPAYVKDPHLPEPTGGTLDRTAELLAKLLSGSEDPDVTALSEAVKAKLGITEPLPQPALASPSQGLSTLAEGLKRSRVSRLLPKVTCPSPSLRAHLDQVPLNYPSETVVQPSSTGTFITASPRLNPYCGTATNC